MMMIKDKISPVQKTFLGGLTAGSPLSALTAGGLYIYRLFWILSSVFFCFGRARVLPSSGDRNCSRRASREIRARSFE